LETRDHIRQTAFDGMIYAQFVDHGFLRSI
jgi:hypothetical protein